MDIKDNFCYECGMPISTKFHFCGRDCAVRYRGIYGKKFKYQLSKTTRFRKKMGMGYHTGEEREPRVVLSELTDWMTGGEWR